MKATSMHNSETIMCCRVCGLLQDEPPWGYDGKCPTYAFCPCCGVEFGRDDTTSEYIQIWRESWVISGGKWSRPKYKPANWNMEAQLKSITD